MFNLNLSEDESALDIALAYYDEGYNVVPLQRSNKKLNMLHQTYTNKVTHKDSGGGCAQL